MNDLTHGGQAAEIEKKLNAGRTLSSVEQQILISWYRSCAIYFLAIGSEDIAAVFGAKHDAARERHTLNMRNGV